MNRRILCIAGVCMALLTPHASAQNPIDTDGDGIPDIEEDTNGNHMVDEGETDPRNADTDDGGESDGSEVRAGRNPLMPEDDLSYDRDGDELSNGEEVLRGTNPDNPDSDGDGVTDGQDFFPLDARYHEDADGDGIADEWERIYSLSSESAADASEDSDNDTVTNLQEFLNNANPLSADTDNDGQDDNVEIADGTNPSVNSCLRYVSPSEGFPDTAEHWAETYIHRLHGTWPEGLGQPVARGYDDGGQTLFLPNRNISRFEFLKLVLSTACVPQASDLWETDIVFSDVPPLPGDDDTADTFLRRRTVYSAAILGIVEGYPDGTFRPDAPVTRAEALAMLFRTIAEVTVTGEADVITFPDVPDDAWFATFVEIGARAGFVRGYEDGTFRPEQFITRAEAAKIIFLSMQANPRVNGSDIPDVVEH